MFVWKTAEKDDIVIMTGDFNSVGNFGDDQGDHMETWAAGLGLKHGYRLWQDLHRTDGSLYTHRQVIAGGMMTETHIDHIWVSLNVGPHVVNYGATQNPLFMSDHCLVACDLWKVGAYGAQSIRHTRLMRHHEALARPFPKARLWQEIQWEEWTQHLQSQVVRWNQLRTVLVQAKFFAAHTSEGVREIRRLMDDVWMAFIASVKTKIAIVNGPNPVRLRSKVNIYI